MSSKHVNIQIVRQSLVEH